MPYEKYMDGEKHCVRKVGEDKALGCHDSEDGANAQLAALNANEEKRKKDYYPPLSQAEVNYVRTSPYPAEKQCANCRFFQYYAWPEEHVTSYCGLVEPHILPTGYCDKWEEIPDIKNEMDPLAVVIVEPEDKSHLAISPAPLQPSVVDKLARRDQSKTFFYRAPDGLRRAIHITSNGYKDRDAEHVATKALERYVESSWSDKGFVGDNVLLFWHHKMLPMGDIIWADVRHGFLIEISKERPGVVWKRLWDFWEKSRADKAADWATSHGFYSLRFTNGVHEDIEKWETSILPRQAAANLLTLSEVISMAKSKSRDEMLAQIFGTEDAVKWLEQGMEGLHKLGARLQANGLESKATKDEGATTEASTDDAPDMSNILRRMAQTLADIAVAQSEQGEQVVALETADKERAKATRDQEKTVGDKLSDIDKRLKAVEAFMADTPKSVTQQRASNVPAAEADKVKDAHKEVDTFWGDLNARKS